MRTLFVFGEKEFKITIPDDARVTFGPWSPGEKSEYNRSARGTLRIYKTGSSDKDCMAVFSGVTSYREEGLDYSEKVAVEEGSTIWKSDQHGYERSEKVKREEQWSTPALETTTKKKKS